MISKIEFKDITNSLAVDATYTRVYNFDYGSIETASEVGLLSQESRSVSFSLVKDSFLENILLTQDSHKKYKVVVTNSDDTIEFNGLLEDNNSISYNIDNQMIDIKLLDIFGFIKNGGDLSNKDKVLFSIEKTVVLGLLSGLKDRLQYDGGEATGALGSFWFYYPDYNFWLTRGLTLVQLDMILSDDTDVLEDYNNRTVIYRAKVIDANGATKYYMHNSDYDQFIFTSDENAVPCNESWKDYIDDQWLRYNWIDLNSFETVGTDGLLKRGKKYVFDYHFDESTLIIGEEITFNQDYQALYNTSVTIAEIEHRFHVDYKRAGVNHYYYWVMPDPNICSENGTFPIKWFDPKHGAFTPSLPLTDNTEFLFCVRNYTITPEIDSKASKYQQSVFVDYVDNTDYTELQIHYLLKMRGCGVNDSTSGTNAFRNGYYYRKRIIRLNGYQIILDNFSESIPLTDRAVGYMTMNAYYSNGNYYYLTNDDGEYWIKRHATEVLDLPSLSDSFSELTSLPEDLFNTKYSIHCNYDDDVYAFSGVYSFIDSKNNTYRLDIGNRHDRSYSGLGEASEKFYRNIARISIKYYGTVNLNSYIYNSPFNTYEALKVAMVSNLFSLISAPNTGELQVVNKVPIINSVALSSNDLINLKQTNTIAEQFDDNLFDVLDVSFADTLNEAIKQFVYSAFRQFNIELEFEYSSIFSGINLKIGDNFDYNGIQYSVVAVTRENDYIVKVRAFKNGISILQLSNNGSTFADAELSNDGILMLDWNVRTV